MAFEGNRKPQAMEARTPEQWRVVLVTRDLPPEQAAENIGRGELWFSRRMTREILALTLEEQGATLLEQLDSTPDLTGRERELGRLLIRGFTCRAAAATLGTSEQAIATHLANLERKLRVNGRHSLALRLASSTQARPA